MKQNISIQLKAALLLIVFSTNIVVGFACAIGGDMGFNSKHHHDQEEETEIAFHVHASDVRHNHHNEVDEHNKNDNSKKDDCCKDRVLKILQTDKAVPQSIILIDPIFNTAFISSFYSIDVFYAHLQIPNIKYFLQNYHPPFPDIRIAIQSFQI